VTALPRADKPGIALPAFAAALGGLLIGGLTLALQGVLPGAWNHLANSGAVWCTAAFAAGALVPARRPAVERPAVERPAVEGRKWSVTAGVAGLAVLFGAVIGYYGSTTLFRHDDVSAAALRGPELWLVIACLAGPVFGVAGRAYRRGDERGRLIGMATLGAIFIAEALYLLVGLHYAQGAAILGAIGVLVPIVLGRSGRERLRGVATLVPLTLIGALVEAVVYLISQAVFLG
jgi:hypothetical protein